MGVKCEVCGFHHNHEGDCACKTLLQKETPEQRAERKARSSKYRLKMAGVVVALIAGFWAAEQFGLLG